MTASPRDELIVHSWPNKIFHTQQNRVSEIEQEVGDEISEVTLDTEESERVRLRERGRETQKIATTK